MTTKAQRDKMTGQQLAAELAKHAVSPEAGAAITARLRAANDTQYPNGIVRRWSFRGVTKYKAFRKSDGRIIGTYDTHADAAAQVK